MTEEGIAAGLPLEGAKRRARLRLGVSEAILEKVREGEISTMLESWYRDFTLGLRSLRRNPVFAITAILTLGVGIGANTVVFTLLYGLLLRSLPVTDPARLVRIGVASATVDPTRASAVPYQMLLQLRLQQKSFTDIAAWATRGVTMDSGDGASRLSMPGLVSGNGFEILGMNAYLGRLLTPADDARAGPAEGWPVVLGYGFWKDSFGGDPSVVGKQIKLSNTIVLSRHEDTILSEALGLLAAGLVLGATMLAVTVRFVDQMLYGVFTFDPLRLAAIAAVLAFVAVAAGLFPALRAASIDPIQALRAE